MMVTVVEEDWRTLLRGMRARGRNGVPQSVIARALDVAPNTVARWASGSMMPTEDYPHVARIRWLAVESRAWYRRVAPILAIPWAARSQGKDDAENLLLEQPGPQFSDVVVSPIKVGRSDLVAYDFTPSQDYPEFRFLSTGIDRNSVLLSANNGAKGSFKASSTKFGPLKKGKVLRLVTLWKDRDGSEDEV